MELNVLTNLIEAQRDKKIPSFFANKWIQEIQRIIMAIDEILPPPPPPRKE